MGDINDESVDLPGELGELGELNDAAANAGRPKPVANMAIVKEEEYAELLAFREKMQWLGRQVNAINEKGEDGRKAAEASAKQVAPMFDGPFEKEIIRFFIKDGGNGNGNGDGSGNASGSGSGQAPAEGGDKGDGESKASSGTGGNGRSDSGTSEGSVLPDGIHEIADIASFSRLGLPKDSPHRRHYVRKVMLEDDGEAFQYIGSAYGIPFNCYKYGEIFTFAGLR